MPFDHKSDVDAIQRLDAVPIILDIVCQVTGMGFAAIARVTEDNWVACATRDDIRFGLVPGGELDVRTTICNDIRASRTPVVIDDVQTDEIYCKHSTPTKYGFRSYISMPIFRGDGTFFGTLCAIDPQPAQVSKPGTIGMFRLFANLIGAQLDAAERLADTQRTVAQQLLSQDIRDQFIAVLGHDLRNPLASINAGMNMLERAGLDARSIATVGLMRKSVRRMRELVDNVLDFARGRLGAGMTVVRSVDVPLQPAIELVIDELKSSNPHRTIKTEIDLREAVNCDPSRIAQMLSNLLANALSHGSKDGQVKAKAFSDKEVFRLEVSNTGDAIPPEVKAHLFQPFSGNIGGGRREGLGLGLYICAEIARAHAGRLDMESDARETRFFFVMPQRA